MGGLAGLQVLHLSCVALLKLLGLLRVALFHLLPFGSTAIAPGKSLMLSILLLLEFLPLLVLLIDQLLLLLFVFLVELGVAAIRCRWTFDRRQVLGMLVTLL